jgi:hypothetical protein
MLPYGAPGAAQVGGLQGQPLHPGYPPPGLVAYPVAPGTGLPRGYLPIEQQQYLMNTGHQLPQPVGMPPQQAAAGAGMGPGAGGPDAHSNSLAGAEADAFAGLVPGMRSSLSAVQPLPPSLPQQQQQQPPHFAQYAPYANHSSQQPQNAAAYSTMPAEAGGGFGAVPGGAAFQAAQPKKGGNPFA